MHMHFLFLEATNNWFYNGFLVSAPCKAKKSLNYCFSKEKSHVKYNFWSSGYDRAYHVLFEKHLENITSIEDGPNR
jgi:hypothetical protein